MRDIVRVSTGRIDSGDFAMILRQCNLHLRHEFLIDIWDGCLPGHNLKFSHFHWIVRTRYSEMIATNEIIATVIIGLQ